jgi:hypothetical protein
MSEPSSPLDIDRRPHVIACSYASEEASLSAYQSLKGGLCQSAGVMRLEFPPGRDVVAVCADDEAAGAYMARLGWGEGEPLGLPSGLCAAVASRRAEGARKAEREGGSHAREGVGQRIPFDDAEGNGASDASGVSLRALNTSATPWMSPGGVIGALCGSAGDAFSIRDNLVRRRLDAIEGMVIAFDRIGDRSLVAVIADGTGTEQLARDELRRLAGNLSYKPSADEAWGLWALRLTAGNAGLPISFDGDFEALAAAMGGGGQAIRHVKAHSPTRNQACTCGSGRKYKLCCGR